MRIKIESFLLPRGNKLGKAAIEFTEEDGILAGFHLVGFTICEDKEKGLFVLFPASIKKTEDKTHTFFFLKATEDKVARLEERILDAFERKAPSQTGINKIRAVE